MDEDRETIATCESCIIIFAALSDGNVLTCAV
jgi:hypothetical protein